MNPGVGIGGWIIIGALAGWIGSKFKEYDGEQGVVANIITGVFGAVLGGFLTHKFLGANAGYQGLIASFAVALAGGYLLIGTWTAHRGRRA
jgi:uncharacterized membrane protein YeaQ/YmgE (transglycosylase-associated protein family)